MALIFSNSIPPDGAHLPEKLTESRGWVMLALLNSREIGRQAMHSKTVPLYYVVNMFYKYTLNVSISSS